MDDGLLTVSSTPQEENQTNLLSSELGNSSEGESELTILTQALEIRNGECDEVRQRLLEEFRKLQSKKEEKIQKLMKRTQDVQQVCQI